MCPKRGGGGGGNGEVGGDAKLIFSLPGQNKKPFGCGWEGYRYG